MSTLLSSRCVARAPTASPYNYYNFYFSNSDVWLTAAKNTNNKWKSQLSRNIIHFSYISQRQRVDESFRYMLTPVPPQSDKYWRRSFYFNFRSSKKAKMPKKTGKSRTSNATLTRAIKRISEAHKASEKALEDSSEKGLEDSPHIHPESSKAGPEHGSNEWLGILLPVQSFWKKHGLGKQL